MSQFDDEILKQILDKVSEGRDAVKDLDKKVDLHIQESRFQFQSIRELDEVQNKILEEHHARSDRLAEDNKLREQSLRLEIQETSKRIERLEAPFKWFNSTKKIIMWLAAIATAAVGILELMEKLK